MIGCGRQRRRAWLASLLLLAPVSCQPLPHPFADDKPPAALLRVRDTVGVSIAPLVGEPAGVRTRLGGALAEALLKRDIPASDRTANLDSYELYGRIVESAPRDGRATVAVLWWLYDAGGKIVGRRRAEAVAAVADWQAGRAGPIAELASLSADRLVPLLEDRMPTPAESAAAAAPSRIRVAIDRVSGAPGDGDRSLKTAIAAVLGRGDVKLVTDPGSAGLHVAAVVAVTPAAAGMQRVRIVWHVRRGDGVEIGTVVQQNDVPKGQLDGVWGDIADTIATAAESGLMQLVLRAAPPKAAAAARSGPR